MFSETGPSTRLGWVVSESPSLYHLTQVPRGFEEVNLGPHGCTSTLLADVLVQASEPVLYPKRSQEVYPVVTLTPSEINFQ